LKKGNNNRFLSEKEILDIGSSLIHKTFGEIAEGTEGIISKGTFGQMIEKKAFEYDVNNKSEPDFVEAGIELKVTPFKRNKNNTFSAKERLVLGIINYLEEVKKDFYTSSFWLKSKKIYLLYYLWEPNKNKEDFMIMYDFLLTFPEEDLLIIKRDWSIIIEKIKNGKAHEISEADTMYLAACTKGVNAETMRRQPNSDVIAKQRAYSLKTSYMTRLLRTKIINNKSEIIKLIDDANELERLSFENILYNRIKPYFGLSDNDLMKRFNISYSKNSNEHIVARILGIKGKVAYTDEFQKANIIPKTIRIEKNNKIRESMSFPAFKFEKIYEEDWEDSELRDFFDTTKFMFVVFKKKNDDYILDDIVFWNMPFNTLEKEVKDVWLHTQSIIRQGNIVKGFSSRGRLTNFINKTENSVMHIRPHGRDMNDTYPLPVPDKLTGLKEYTKQCFWLNNDYVLKILKKNNN
jgi:DNA mismatch repair protein MutH